MAEEVLGENGQTAVFALQLVFLLCHDGIHVIAAAAQVLVLLALHRSHCAFYVACGVQWIFSSEQRYLLFEGQCDRGEKSEKESDDRNLTVDG